MCFKNLRRLFNWLSDSRCVSLSPSRLFETATEAERWSGSQEDDGRRGRGEDESADLRGEKELFSGRVESWAWLRHTALPVFIPITCLWLLTSFNQPMPRNPTSTRSLFFSYSLFQFLWRFGSPLSSPSSSFWLSFTTSFLWFSPTLSSFLTYTLCALLFSSLPVAQRGVR